MSDDDPRRTRRRPYFAYGSNMLHERLIAADRAPSACPLGVGRLAGHRLDFHKRSWSDRSGKCTITATRTETDSVHGVLFRVDPADHPALDEVEGLGSGYRLTLVEVEPLDAPGLGTDRVEAWTYVGMGDFLEPGLLPFGWYRDLVVAGARQHGLPDSTVRALVRQPVVEDPDPARAARARAILATAGMDAHTSR